MKNVAGTKEQKEKLSAWKKIRSMKEFSVLVILLVLVLFISVLFTCVFDSNKFTYNSNWFFL